MRVFKLKDKKRLHVAASDEEIALALVLAGKVLGRKDMPWSAIYEAMTEILKEAAKEIISELYPSHNSDIQTKRLTVCNYNRANLVMSRLVMSRTYQRVPVGYYNLKRGKSLIQKYVTY